MSLALTQTSKFATRIDPIRLQNSPTGVRFSSTPVAPMSTGVNEACSGETTVKTDNKARKLPNFVYHFTSGRLWQKIQASGKLIPSKHEMGVDSWEDIKGIFTLDLENLKGWRKNSRLWRLLTFIRRKVDRGDKIVLLKVKVPKSEYDTIRIRDVNWDDTLYQATPHSSIVDEKKIKQKLKPGEEFTSAFPRIFQELMKEHYHAHQHEIDHARKGMTLNEYIHTNSKIDAPEIVFTKEVPLQDVEFVSQMSPDDPALENTEEKDVDEKAVKAIQQFLK